ncbi:MAG TPA: serine/threonine-protein kinase [Haliangiales bacterium]|nr:serine/threonine-protein kinase [Haliangiales bacterium]
MTLLDRLARLLRRPAAAPPEPPPAAPEPPAAKPPTDEDWLCERIEAAAAGNADAAAALAEAKARFDALLAEGRTRRCAELLARAAPVVAEGGQALRARAAELFWERGDTADAVPLLVELTAAPAHAARANFLLGEHFRGTGDRRRALRHFEAVLALDVGYPNARARVEALKAALGRPAAAAVGQTLLGPGVEVAGARYHLVRELGRGATGVVYLARDVELGRDVAVKLLHPQLGSPRSPALRRFFTEARVAAALRHPHIVAILDLDEKHRRLVMELCAGGTLRERLARGALPLATALARHVELLSALASAHRRGIVHRDVKPANLLYRRDPDAPASEAVLGDFGTAHLIGDAERAAVGTPLYMAPEQRKGEATPAGDVFSAGVILYETLVGRPPWQAAEALRGAQGPLALPASFPDAVARHVAALGAADPGDRPSAEAARAEAERI